MPAPGRSPGQGTVQRYPLLTSLVLIARHSRLLVRAVELARAAVTEFFLPQFETRLFPGARPVVTLAHPLDERMPFQPHRLRFYLGYMGLFLKTLGFIHETCGPAARPDIARMFEGLYRLYYLSGAVYRRCQSTTPRRLPLQVNLYSLLIRLFDPHLHCVPSLHILAVCYNYWAAREVLRRRLPSGHPALACPAELFDMAVRITETVLLVKQHSVLDIAPSLFLLSRAFPGYGDTEVERFVGALFRGGPALAGSLRKEVLRGYRELKQLDLHGPAADPSARLVEYLGRQAAVSDPPEGTHRSGGRV